MVEHRSLVTARGTPFDNFRCQGDSLSGASHMPRPIMILAGERQPSQQVSPIREQNVTLRVAPYVGRATVIRVMRTS